MKNILILCTGNSARSVIAECLINHLSHGAWTAYSAGSNPTGTVNPLTLAVLAENGHPTYGYRSKSWDVFAGSEAPAMDVVMTVCDNAAGEICPIWPGHPSKLHIGFPDPAAATGTDEEKLAEFRKVYRLIEATVRTLIDQDFAGSYV